MRTLSHRMESLEVGNHLDKQGRGEMALLSSAQAPPVLVYKMTAGHTRRRCEVLLGLSHMLWRGQITQWGGVREQQVLLDSDSCRS